jgi:hypothetical protein
VLLALCLAAAVIAVLFVGGIVEADLEPMRG